ncbi:MAG: sigma-70 family RNA polymerase sigma factor [Candidatus Vogelbacteria bacterium]|nr:sigma-70 family RNA polymerase sigma factor [Candidatus Vogelbacteria bacterium]
MEETDVELITKSKNGDLRSFDLLVIRYLKSILNFAYRLTNNHDDADDVTQETFLKAWKNLDSFDINKSFKTWIFTIARNTVTDLFRKKKSIPSSFFNNEEGENPLLDNLADTEPLPDQLILIAENKKLLEDTLNQIPINYKEVLLLRYMEDLTFEEISEALGRPSNTIRSQHKRGLLLLRKLLTNATK